jgi:hypothetical protein
MGSKTPVQPDRMQKAPDPQPETKSSYHFMDMKSFRETRKTTDWKNRPQKWWDLFAVLCGVGIAVIWILYTGVPSSSEGFDFLSPLLMIGMPIVLVLFRNQIDSLLNPIQPFRKKLSPMFLVGISIAAPFLTAVILFNILGISEYSLIHWNLIIGTFLAYAISRDPGPPSSQQRGVNPKMTMVLFFICFVAVCISPVIADDCLTDPLNAADCARTGLIAQLLAAAPAAALGNLLNVPNLSRRIYSPAAVKDLSGQLSPADVMESEDGKSWQERNEEEWQESLRRKREGYIQQENGDWIPREQDYNWNHNRLTTKLGEIATELARLRDEHQKTVIECKRKYDVFMYDSGVTSLPVIGHLTAAEYTRKMAEKLKECLLRAQAQKVQIEKLEGEMNDVNNQLINLEASRK